MLYAFGLRRNEPVRLRRGGGQFQGEGVPCDLGDYDVVVCSNSFEDISGSGTALNLGDDDGAIVPIGFTFHHHGADFTDIGVSSNGYLTFGPELADFSNEPIPDPREPNDLIAALWDDFAPNAGGSVHYQTLGSPGSQRLICQWTDVPQFHVDDANTFQAVLFEGTNIVELRYGTFTPEAFDNDYTVGLENIDGTRGASYDATTLSPGDCVQFTPRDPDVCASECSGDPQYNLTMPATAPIGEIINITIEGPPNNLAALFVSLGEGPVDSNFGTLCISFPTLITLVLPIPPNGSLTIPALVPCDGGIVGVTVYSQFIGFDPATMGGGVSNQATTTFVDGPCP